MKPRQIFRRSPLQMHELYEEYFRYHDALSAITNAEVKHEYIRAKGGYIKCINTNVAINAEIDAIAKILETTIMSCYKKDINQVFASLLEMIQRIYQYRENIGCKGLAIGNADDLVKFFSDYDVEAIFAEQESKAKQFYAKKFSDLNVYINGFFKLMFENYIDSLHLNLNDFRYTELKNMFDKTFNNDMGVSPVALLIVLHSDCNLLLHMIDLELVEDTLRATSIKYDEIQKEHVKLSGQKSNLFQPGVAATLDTRATIIKQAEQVIEKLNAILTQQQLNKVDRGLLSTSQALLNKEVKLYKEAKGEQLSIVKHMQNIVEIMQSITQKYKTSSLTHGIDGSESIKRSGMKR